MKIFAKRKKKTSSAGEPAAPSKERSTFESDPIVEELLKKDPKEWNSKQRRMIKRYQERNLESVEGSSDAIPKESSSSAEAAASSQTGKSKDMDAAKRRDENEKEESESENVKETNNEQKPKKSQQEEADTLDEEPAVDDANKGLVSPEDEVYKLLEQLNSKMKRTLSRRLEREGISALDDVRTEATKILGKDSEPKENPKKRGTDVLKTEASTNDEQKSGTKKRKKDSTDWAALPPEERLRREEQRRLQQEAAERRARGEDKTPGFKHPLNSERRRANRRKSKWKNKSASPGTKSGKNEHNHSGFLHRKQSG